MISSCHQLVVKESIIDWNGQSALLRTRVLTDTYCFAYIITHAEYVVNNVNGRLVCADPIKPTPRGC